jgi:hypothetical protein
MKPDGIIQDACSGAPSRVSITIIAAVLEERLTVFTIFLCYIHFLHTHTHPPGRYKGHLTVLAPLSKTFQLHPRADPPVQDRSPSNPFQS